MDVTAKEKMRYDAFISYRHSDLDKFVAEELHKQLEMFKVPKNIAKSCNKKKISRIFRDKDELPITSNLADPILNALRLSEFLIVICSPRLKESLWCKREIENFIEMHGQEKVLAVLIEGEPKDSFPEELLYRKTTVTLANGETKEIKEPIEPLAADVRGKNKKEIKKLIKIEMLRILASMLQCNFDDLKQRHKERKMQRMLALAAVVCTVGIIFGTVSTVMALRIHDQKEQIDRQYWEALETNAIMGADNAMELLEKGDRIGAIKMARELLPDDLKNQTIPYTSEAFYALTQSVYPYMTGNVLCPVFQIKENAEITEIGLSDDRNKVYVRTKYDGLTVWDIPNKQKCLQINMKQFGNFSLSYEVIEFIGEDKLALLTDNEILLFDLDNNENGEIAQRIPCGNDMYTRGIVCDSNGKYIVVEYDKAIVAYDAVSGQELHTVYAPENMEVMSGEGYFCGEQTLIMVCGGAFLSNEKADFSIQLINIEEGTVVREFIVPYGNLAQLGVSDGALFVAVNGASKDTTSIFDTVDDAEIYCYDLNTGAKRWQYHVEKEFINKIVLPYEGYDCFLFESYAQITALEAKTGNMIGVFGFGGSIVEIFPLQTPDTYVVFTRAGGRINFMPEKNYNAEVSGVFIPATDNIKQMKWGSTYMIALPYASKELIVYEWYTDEGAQEIMEFEDSIIDFVVSEDEKYSVVELYTHELLVLDNETKEILGQTMCDSYGDGLHFVKDNMIQRISGEEVFLYDLECNLVKQYALSDEYIDVEGVSADGKYAFADGFDTLYVINCEAGEVEGSIPKEACDYTSQCTYFFNNRGDICVIIDTDTNQCRTYDIATSTLLYAVDMNATYIENVQFSEDDEYVYFIYEDGKVVQYISATMEVKCEIDGLDSVTDVIVEKTVNGENNYYFFHTSGAYVLKDIDGQLKVEQAIDELEAVMTSKDEYWLLDYETLIVLPIYNYEEMLGKAEQICYDNSLWNNN